MEALNVLWEVKPSAHSTVTPKDNGNKIEILSWSILIRVPGAVNLRGLLFLGGSCQEKETWQIPAPGIFVLLPGSMPAAQPVGSPWGWSIPAALPGMGSRQGTEQAAHTQAAHRSRWLFYNLAASVWLCARSASQITNEAGFFFTLTSLKIFF